MLSCIIFKISTLVHLLFIPAIRGSLLNFQQNCHTYCCKHCGQSVSQLVTQPMKDNLFSSNYTMLHQLLCNKAFLPSAQENSRILIMNPSSFNQSLHMHNNQKNMCDVFRMTFSFPSHFQQSVHPVSFLFVMMKMIICQQDIRSLLLQSLICE